MLVRLVVALAVVLLAVLIARVIRERRAVDPPTQARGQLPSQLDRADFARPEVAWLVAVFTSESCSTCADVVSKARVLESDDVAIEVASFQQRRALHERYEIDAVPAVVIADRDGVVGAAFLGPVTATDLWAAVAEAREPGSVDGPDSCDRHTS